MENPTFSQDMKKTRTVFYLSLLMMFVFGVVGALLYFFGGENYLQYVVIIAVFGILVFIISLIVIYLSYSVSAEAKQKRTISRSIHKNLKKIPAASQNLADAQTKINAIKGYFQGKIAEEDQKLTSLADTVRQAVASITADREQELSTTLANLQKDHVDAGLRQVSLDAGQVPGIGDVLQDTLKSAGIQTALDVTREAVDAIPGFGESKALSLLRWRESLEYPLKETQPKILSLEVADAINARHDQLVTAQHEGLARFQSEHDAAIAVLREKESKELSGYQVAEIAARQELDRLEAETGTLQSQAVQYKSVTFPRFLIAVIRGLQATWQKKTLSLLAYILFFLLALGSGILLVLAYLKMR